MPQTKPWEKYGAAPSGLQPIPISGPDPYKPQAQTNDNRRVDLQEQNTRREVDRTRLQNPQDLRQEYEKLPEVQAYRTMLSVATKATSTAPGPQGDLSLTYAYSKAMDPTSSVREGEQAAVAGSQPALQAIVEKIKKQFGVDGAGNFTPQARAALRMEIFRAAAAMKPLYDRARADMEDHSRAVGVDPKEVIGRDDTATYAPIFRAYGEKEGDDGTISRLIGGEPIKGATIASPDGGPVDPAGYGATKAGGKIPPEMQQEYSTYINQNWGKLNPSDFAAFRINLDRKYGFGSNSEGYRSDAGKMNEIALKGQGPEVVGPLTPPDRSLTPLEQVRNDAVDNPYGAAAATTMNGVGWGLPSLLAGDQFNAIRKAHPVASVVGDVAGGVGGALLGGGALRAGGKMLLERGSSEAAANILSKPLTADMLYGGIYGANDAAGRGENAIVGGLTGLAGGAIGNKVGGAIGKAFPGSVGVGGAIKKLDASVPTSDDLKALASSLYQGAEAKGLTGTPDETLALADGFKSILSREGRLSPTDRLTEVQPKVKEAFGLVNDYAGQPITPTQIQTVRGVVADSLSGADPSERRMGSMLLDHFDNWTDATNPDLASGLRDARGVASRYLQGDKIASMRELAEPGAAQYSQSGMANALRTQYRGLDRAITKGSQRFAPNVVDAVENVARGDPLRNALRYVGKLAPTGQMGMYGTMGASMAGGSMAGTAGGAVPLGLALLGTGARRAEMGLADRAATVAENSAYGGPDYTAALTRALSDAGARGGNAATGAIAGGGEPRLNDIIARLMLSYNRQPASAP